MGLSRLSKQCRKCTYVDSCNHKRMEALAYLNEASNIAGVNAATPTIQPHDYRNIKVSESMTITVDMEEVKRKLEQSMYPNFLQYGG